MSKIDLDDMSEEASQARLKKTTEKFLEEVVRRKKNMAITMPFLDDEEVCIVTAALAAVSDERSFHA